MPYAAYVIEAFLKIACKSGRKMSQNYLIIKKSVIQQVGIEIL
jgi:hypothetical protein